jgi:hypothetical protein
MKAHTLFSKTAAGMGSLAIVFAMSACSHHTSIAEQAGQNTGEIRTEQTAQSTPSGGEVLGTAPAPANAQATSNPGTPAVISGPAAVDSTGRVYTSSSVGSAGNAAAVGTNTNVNIVPQNTTGSTTLVTETTPAPVVTTAPIETPVVVETVPAPVVVETPAPAPVVVETTPAPAPVIVETPAPMTSSTTTTETTTTTQTRHRRLRKD